MGRNTLLVNLGLVLGSTILSVLLGEMLLRHYQGYSGFGAGTELTWMRNHPDDLLQQFTLDPEFGFRPVLGNDRYTEYGTLVAPENTYAVEKPPGVERLLFIGDSVTRRGVLIEALKQVYGEEDYEYWNAGVESFNTVQEVSFYRKYNAGLHPDHVILTFHLNDFETTPVAFVNAEGKLVVYAPHRPLKGVNRWLFKQSYVYRLVLGFLLGRDQGKDAIRHEIRESLSELRDLLARENIALTILVLPFIKPYETWRPPEKQAREHILQVAEALSIRHIDLLEPLQQATREGVALQARPGDFWHPSEDAARVFAGYLFDNHLLTKTGEHP